MIKLPKIKWVFIMTAAFCSFFAGQTAFAVTGPVFIDTNTNGVFDAGESSFATIQAAINATSSGDTIRVSAGTYNESLNITKPVTLQSVGGRDVTTIKSLTIATSSVAVSGFTIEGVNASGVASANIFLNSGVSNTTVSNNKIINVGVGSGNGDNGIGLLTTSNLVLIGDNLNVTGNIFQALDTGSNRAYFINPGINHFTFSGNTITGNFTHAATTQAKNGLVENNTITGAGAVGSRSAGFRAWGYPDPTVWGHTTFSGNTVSGAKRGITADEANNVTITGNTLSGNEMGVWVTANDSLPFDITTISVHNNNLSGEDALGFGVINDTAITTKVDASSNWWGSASPVFASIISGPVTYDPYYINVGMTTLSTVTSGATINVAAGNLVPQGTSGGAVSLPVGTSNIILGNDSVINFASSTNIVNGGTVVIAGATATLSSFTSGVLAGINLSTPQNIGGQSVTVGAAVQLSSGSNGVPIVLTNSALASASVSIPDDTTILAPSGWNGTVMPPKTGSSVGDTAPSGFSVGGTVVDVGSPSVVLLFDKPVTVTLNGVTRDVAYKPSGSATWTKIITVCGGTYDAPTLSASIFPGECSITNGINTKILTHHFTSFGELISNFATLHVIKLVINGSGGTGPGILHNSDFTIHVKNTSTTLDVSGSPLAGATAPGTSYSLPAGTYTISEDVNTSYVKSFSLVGACDSSGIVTLALGDNKTCTIINTDIPAPLPVGPRGYGGYTPHFTPLIGILKVPTPLALPGGPGSVTYNYAVWNVGGRQPLVGVSVIDDKCRPTALLSGDLNNNNKLDPGENWRYGCTTTLSTTTTNTAIATGYSDDELRQVAIATAVTTVVVGAQTSSPLISIVKVPSRLTIFPFGGGDVTYTYGVTNPGVVAIHDVTVTDDKCKQVSGPLGDVNGNKLLDPGEVWAYTCKMNVPISTRNAVTVEGKANGFIAWGYAFADVLVATPGFPEAGSPSIIATSSRGITRAQAIATFHRSLGVGSKGNDVEALQIALEQKGLLMVPAGVAKGYFGSLTRAAIRKYQANTGLPQVGVFGPLTRAKLISELGK